MKTPTNKEKAQFFALYFGQKVFIADSKHDDLIENVSCWRITNAMTGYPQHYLLLRSVGQLKDEEAITCASIGFSFLTEVSGHELKVIREINRISVAATTDNGKNCVVKHEVSNEYKLNIGQVDYLRSIGMILPFTYLSEDNQPITLSPSEIIALDWVKIATP